MTTADSISAIEAESVALAAWRRINAAVESGAPVPDNTYISTDFNNVVISYHVRKNAAAPDDRAAAMVRVLGLNATRKDEKIPGGATAEWTEGQFQVVAHLPKPLITDPIELAAAYGFFLDPKWMTPDEHPLGTYPRAEAD